MTTHDPASPDADFSTLDPAFEFDYVAIDDPTDGGRFTRYWDLEPLQRGPQPVPDWLVTDRAAVEHELGILKTGKEAEVFLLERSVPATGASCVLAAKRYRGEDHRDFHRNDGYTQGRRVRDTRVTRAMAKKSSFGRQVAAGQWAGAEWESLKRCYELGVPVPYPVQIDGTEILMELITVDGEAAPRLANTRPERALLEDWFDQLRSAMVTLAERGLAHGDLSPYNILAAGERLVIIDLPQMVDVVANPQGSEFLMRDCHNVCTWFVRRGLEVDEHELFAELLAASW
ncbi:serine/threonine protein kinase [Nocardioides marmoriginsengisoli]|uniref:non-specific serine/threonine protein kinase n=1 Tax=Nocardioides marmoriginsengisoli TaxID=661483 RepID=A0A3N0CP53_9ACTN|nr:RIO1 family regulatory kinase/ATPase [Nocardioides marmoriginsengisoli]RNL65109.1 serine/threonine protein kinase [Nocardioides marmoriginsengisoli]